nr:hypothetical protein [Shewanella sp.]
MAHRNYHEVPFLWRFHAVHHWHHSSDSAAIDRNYAAHFSFIDYLLGTALRDQQEWPEE